MRAETIVLYSGIESDPATHAVAVPIYQNVAYAFDSADQALAAALENTPVLRAAE
jgi:O-acetylhomoserine (thiol)-lyase